MIDIGNVSEAIHALPAFESYIDELIEEHKGNTSEGRPFHIVLVRGRNGRDVCVAVQCQASRL